MNTDEWTNKAGSRCITGAWFSPVLMELQNMCWAASLCCSQLIALGIHKPSEALCDPQASSLGLEELFVSLGRAPLTSIRLSIPRYPSKISLRRWERFRMSSAKHWEEVNRTLSWSNMSFRYWTICCCKGKERNKWQLYVTQWFKLSLPRSIITQEGWFTCFGQPYLLTFVVFKSPLSLDLHFTSLLPKASITSCKSNNRKLCLLSPWRLYTLHSGAAWVPKTQKLKPGSHVLISNRSGR